MKTSILAGMLLIVLGVVALVYQGVTYTTQREVLDLGPIEVHREEKKTIPLPPVLWGAALAGGIVLVLVGSRKA